MSQFDYKYRSSYFRKTMVFDLIHSVFHLLCVTQPRYPILTPVPSVSGAPGSSSSRFVLAERFNCINVTGFFHRVEIEEGEHHSFNQNDLADS